MEQSVLNKKLYEAIHKEINWLYKSEDVTQPAAIACEIICLQEKIDLLNYILGNYTCHSYSLNENRTINELQDSLTEQLNSLKNGR